jgi:hypothetical protein
MTFVLVWKIDDKPGAFCPSGGLTLVEAEKARDRLLGRLSGTIFGAFEVSLVPYVFDINDVPMNT